MRVKELDLLRARRNVEYVVMLCLIVLAAAVSVFVWVRRQNKMYRTLVTQYRSYIHRLEEISESRKETGDETTKEDAQYKKLFLRIESLMNTEKYYRDKDMSIDRMARTIGSNRVYVSRAINSCTGGNFCRYLDSYRIKEATRIIQNAGATFHSRRCPMR